MRGEEANEPNVPYLLPSAIITLSFMPASRP